ncbi:hypothetical protein Zm00014a_032159 [Zea mays]|uniref:Uncharacterized protein n=1 Tax=Zea mays TaxID=4577 RepID=A0A317YC98_MAIZE|nr:hypothetical protein Zm00014a_032159 [Zea mays]
MRMGMGFAGRGE